MAQQADCRHHSLAYEKTDLGRPTIWIMKVSWLSRGTNEDRRENEDDELVALGTANARCARSPICRTIRWLQQNGSRRADCCGRYLLPVFAVGEIGHLHPRSRNSWVTSRHRQRPFKEFMRSGSTILAVTQPALKARTVQKAIFESGWWPVRGRCLTNPHQQTVEG